MSHYWSSTSDLPRSMTRSCRSSARACAAGWGMTMISARRFQGWPCATRCAGCWCVYNRRRRRCCWDGVYPCPFWCAHAAMTRISGKRSGTRKKAISTGIKPSARCGLDDRHQPENQQADQNSQNNTGYHLKRCMADHFFEFFFWKLVAFEEGFH